MKKIKFILAFFAVAILASVISHFLEPVLVEAQQRILNNPIIRGRMSIVSTGHSWDGNLISDADGTDAIGSTLVRWDVGYFDEVFWQKGADVASATTTALGADGNYYDITGTTTITSITIQNVGKVVALQFDGILTLTDGSNLKLHGNFITAAGATIFLQSDGTDWYELSRAGGNYIVQGAFTADALSTLTGNVTVTADIDVGGVLTTDGINRSDVIVVDSTPYTVLAANTGLIHVITALSQNTSIDFPAEADGLNYEFWYVGGADDGDDHEFDTENNTNFFIGGVAFADTDAGSGADEINGGVYSNGSSNSKLLINNISAGTVVKFTCDGTNWYVAGVVYSDTIPVFADQ